MEFHEFLDFALKSFVTLSGIGLIGMMVLRTDARGRFKMIGFEQGPVVQPKWAPRAKAVACAFAIAVVVVLARSSGGI
jgi:hypothetical protein